MSRPTKTVLVVLALGAALVLLLLPRDPAGYTSGPNRPRSAAQTTRIDRWDDRRADLAPLIERWNDFIVRAHPYGMDTAIRPADVISCQTNYNGKIIVMETEAHLVEFHRGKLAFFMSKYDGSHARAETGAREKWYQATAPWTKEQALKETHAIIQRLGLKISISNEIVEPFTLHVNTPGGARALATPFYTVEVLATNGSRAVVAEFRMGQSGPGRLTRWSNNTGE